MGTSAFTCRDSNDNIAPVTNLIMDTDHGPIDNRSKVKEEERDGEAVSCTV